MERLKYNARRWEFGDITHPESKLTFILELPREEFKRRTAIFMCECGNLKQIAIDKTRGSKATKSCGCIQREWARKNLTNHGYGKDDLYGTWFMMMARCYNENNKAFKNYGARGIEVCDRWSNEEDGLENFIKDMGNKPTKKHTLERIKCDGNYSPENCMWIDRSHQSYNRRMDKKNKTGVTGVWYNKKAGNYQAYIAYKGKKRYLGVHKNIEDAIKARKDAELKYYGYHVEDRRKE